MGHYQRASHRHADPSAHADRGAGRPRSPHVGTHRRATTVRDDRGSPDLHNREERDPTAKHDPRSRDVIDEAQCGSQRGTTNHRAKARDDGATTDCLAHACHRRARYQPYAYDVGRSKYGDTAARDDSFVIASPHDQRAGDAGAIDRSEPVHRAAAEQVDLTSSGPDPVRAADSQVSATTDSQVSAPAPANRPICTAADREIGATAAPVTPKALTARDAC